MFAVLRALTISTIVAALIAVPGVSSAQPAPSASADAPPAETIEASEPAPDSPRASVEHYLELCRSGRYAEAADYLDLSGSYRTRGAELAERLKRVLDRHAFLDTTTLSSLSDGYVRDGLGPGVDEVATVPGPAGRPESVRVARMALGDQMRWRFTRATVARIDGWYDRLGQKWLYSHLPPVLLRAGPLDILWWQWIALPLLFAAAWVIGLVLSGTSRSALGRVARKTRSDWDDSLLLRVRGPLTLAWSAIAGNLLLPWIGLRLGAEDFLTKALRGALLFAFFWALLRGLGVIARLLAASPWAVQYPASRSLIPLGTRVAKVLLLAIAVVAMLAQLGYPVASLIAGLGIGGLAVALAAQKTVENLFGAFSIGVDQPFREGDFIKVEDVLGTVEAVGLRSTKIRTLERTVVSIPNGKLAELRIETFAARDRVRLFTKLSVVYETTAEQMRQILQGIEKVLIEHPRTTPDSVAVRFAALSETSLDIEVAAYIETKDGGEFTRIRQDLLLEFIAVVERAGSAFALPTRTVRLESAEGMLRAVSG